jgi:hypothetical protein
VGLAGFEPATKANDNPIATAAIVVGGGVTVGPILAAYFAVPVAFAAEMLFRPRLQ